MTSTTYRRKVRFSDTDPQGVVFNANYFTYVDDAMTDFFEHVGLSFPDLAERGFDPVVVHAECDFRSPGRIGETLVTEVRAEKFGDTSIVFGFEIAEETSGRPVATGHEVYVFLDRGRHEPIHVPDFIRAAFGAPGGDDA
jgi:acyl-CoA thioester hydrolase